MIVCFVTHLPSDCNLYKCTNLSNRSGAAVAEYEEVQIPNNVSATNDQSFQCDEDLTMTECAAYGHFEY